MPGIHLVFVLEDLLAGQYFRGKLFFESGEQFLEMLNSLEQFNECPKLKAF
jgi:hypothetical protein